MALLVFGIVVLVGIAHPAGAELRIEVERRTVVASPTDPVEGFFDVFFRIVEPDEGRNDLAGFDLVINLPPPEDGITFGNAQLTESPHPPVFPGIPPITFPNGSNQLRVQSFTRSCRLVQTAVSGRSP